MTTHWEIRSGVHAVAVDPPAATDALVVGAGLCGSLLALALVQRGARVTLVDDASVAATRFSYGGIPWWAGADDALGQLQSRTLDHWYHLQEGYGDLGLGSAHLLLHWPTGDHPAAALQAIAELPHGVAGRQLCRQDLEQGAFRGLRLQCGGALELPYARIDPQRFRSGITRALVEHGVFTCHAHVTGLWLSARTCRGVKLDDGTLLEANAVVLANGANLVSLLPFRPGTCQLSCTRAGVLRLPLPQPFPDVIVMPLLGRRQQLERQGYRKEEASVIDPGLAPCSGGVLMGQASSLDPPGSPRSCRPDQQDRQLRQAVADFAPGLATATALEQATFHSCRVAFSPDGRPWVGAWPGVEKLWVFGGFSGAFALAPVLAPLLAEAINGGRALDPALGVEPWQRLGYQAGSVAAMGFTPWIRNRSARVARSLGRSTM